MILKADHMENNHSWQLLKHLSSREIKARYKQSFLGFFWIVLNPLFQLIILSFVFSNVIRFENLGVPYPVFLFVGLLSWIFFDTAVSQSSSALTENAALLKQVYFPRELLVASVVIAKALDFFIASVVLLFLMIIFHVSLTPLLLLILPIFVLQAIFTFSFALIISSLNLFYRDTQYFFGLILKLWFYLTPVIYPMEVFPDKWRFIFKLNPMSVFINAYRQVLLAHDWPNFISLGIGVFVTLTLFILSYGLFKKLEGSFADVV